MELVATGSLLGVRESRRIVGEYEVDYRGLHGTAQLPRSNCRLQQVGRYPRPRLLRRTMGALHRASFSSSDRPGLGEYYGLPYGILVPRGWQQSLGGRPLQFERRQGPWRDPRSTRLFHDGPGRRNRRGAIDENRSTSLRSRHGNPGRNPAKSRRLSAAKISFQKDDSRRLTLSSWNLTLWHENRCPGRIHAQSRR
jgi:hypothetical protein